MGAQVYNPVMRRVHQSPAPPRFTSATRAAPSRLNRVKCNLFGKVDSVATKKYFDEHFKEHCETKSKMWNFDFLAGQPLKNGKYDWKAVRTVPPGAAMITLTQAAHVIPTSSSSSQRQHPYRRSNSDNGNRRMSAQPTMEELMDQRANRANERDIRVGESADDSLSSTSSTLSSSAPTSPAAESTERIATYPIIETRDSIISALSREQPQLTAPASPTRLQQRKITDYLQERKRPSTSSAERISVKKMRPTEPTSAPSSATSVNANATTSSK